MSSSVRHSPKAPMSAAAKKLKKEAAKRKKEAEQLKKMVKQTVTTKRVSNHKPNKCPHFPKYVADSQLFTLLLAVCVSIFFNSWASFFSFLGAALIGITTMTPYTCGMLNSSASFPESPQARVLQAPCKVWATFRSKTLAENHDKNWPPKGH